MKKLYLLLLVTLFSFFAKAQTSVYHPLPDSAAVWNITSFEWCGILFDSWTHSYSITLTNDTIIGANSYHKLEVPVEVILSNGSCGVTGIWTALGYYAGAIRQDIPNKKVYIVPHDSTTEELIYDFNLQVGDTVRGHIESFSGFDDVVQSIDSVLVGNSYRKRWNINPWYSISIIEGVGSTYGLIEPSPGPVTDADGFTISCFSQNNNTLYPTTTTNCEIITSIKDLTADNISATISPNPFHNVSTLMVNKTFENSELRIYNSIGNLVLRDKLIERNYTLKRNNLPQGIYFLQLTNNKNELSTIKFIVE